MPFSSRYRRAVVAAVALGCGLLAVAGSTVGRTAAPGDGAAGAVPTLADAIAGAWPVAQPAGLALRSGTDAGDATVGLAAADEQPACDPVNAGVLSFSTSSLTVPEAAGERLVLVLRDSGGAGSVSARVTSSDGGALAGSDFTSVDTQVDFADGDETVELVRIPIVPDVQDEPNETLTLTLSDPTCATIGGPATVTVTILDDDLPGTFAIGGTVTGLAGTGLTIENNFFDDISPGNGAFTFPTGLPEDSEYTIRVTGQPSDPQQNCSVTNGAGTVPGHDVTDVAVTCVTIENPGGLDPGFGTDGIVATLGLTGAQAIALQPDGKIVVAGSFLLARYNPDGTPDLEFGTAGTVRTLLGAAFLGDASDVALQPDGSIVVVGVVNNFATTREDFGVQRYDARGVLDTSFGAAGLATTDFTGGSDRAYAAAIQPDGAILVAGHAAVLEPAPLGGSDFALVRYLPTGVPDETFGTAGKATTDIAGAADFGFDLALQPDGKPVVVGRVSSDGAGGEQFGAVRYTTAGVPDPEFGAGGIAVAGFESGGIPRGVAVGAEGSVLLAGHTSSGGSAAFGLARFDAAGRADASFDTDGLLASDVGAPDGPVPTSDFGRDVAIQSDGSIVVVGDAQSTGDMALARYLPDGSFDPTFGSGGRMTLDVRGGFDSLSSVLVQPDGRIVAAGSSFSNGLRELVLVRLLG